MTNSAKMTAAYFDTQNINYELNETNNVMKISFGMENFERLEMVIVFDEGDTSCMIRSVNYIKAPADKKDVIINKLNELNEDFRWVKFVLVEKYGMIEMYEDAVIQLDSCGEEIDRCIYQMCSVGDRAYPEIQKVLWA